MFTVRDRRHKRAILFNGPQLGFSVPELFVELEVHRPGLDVRGVTAPGVPVIGIGHNADVAWGLTSGLSDEDDLYAEQASGDTYRFKGRVRSMSCRDERFDYRSPPSGLLGLGAPERGLADGAPVPHGPRPGPGARRQRGLRPALRDLGTRDRDPPGTGRRQRGALGQGRRPRRAQAHVEREHHGRRLRGPHRLLASRACSSCVRAGGTSACPIRGLARPSGAACSTAARTPT